MPTYVFSFLHLINITGHSLRIFYANGVRLELKKENLKIICKAASAFKGIDIIATYSRKQ